MIEKLDTYTFMCMQLPVLLSINFDEFCALCSHLNRHEGKINGIHYEIDENR